MKTVSYMCLQEKHDVDVNEQNPDLELLVEKKMWEIDMDAVTDGSKEWILFGLTELCQCFYSILAIR